MSFQLLLDIYGYRAMFSPELIVFLMAIAAMYFLVTGPLRRRFNRIEHVPVRKKVFFMIGLMLAYAGFGGPLNLIGHFQFTIHMVQQSILYMLMPPMLYFGLPEGMLRGFLNSRSTISKGFQFFIKKPLLPIVLFNGLFSLYHMPVVFDTVMTNIYYHHAFHLILVFLSFCSWWSVLELISGWSPYSGLQKMGYLIINSVLLTPACALIIFANAPLFQIYTEGAKELCLPFYSLSLDTPQLFNIMSPLHDQQLGGVLMKLIQEIAYGMALFYTFRQWYLQERDDEFDELSADYKPKYS